jgi:alkylhydroperoxidase family enzyme
MSRLQVPASVEASPEASRAPLNAVAKSLGSVPNLFRVVGNSPATLEGYLGLSGAVAASSLDAKTQTAVRAAGFNDAAVVEIVLTAALNTFTNYINEVAKTDIDFPVVTARRLAA